MLREDLEEYLNTYLHVPLIEDYCPNGIQVEGRGEIKKIGTAVSANLRTLEKAAEEGVQALIVHHGLFWNRDPYPIVGTKRAKIELLLKEGISLFAYHLPLDAHQEVGNNWQAARALGWENLEPFGPYNGTIIGVKGTFRSRPIKTFVEEVEAYYAHPATLALGGKERVSSAALISGGAYKELVAAARAGVECYITGNFDEPAWGIAFEEKINFLALGHTATEKIGPKALAQHIQEKFSVPCSFIEEENPF